MHLEWNGWRVSQTSNSLGSTFARSKSGLTKIRVHTGRWNSEMRVLAADTDARQAATRASETAHHAGRCSGTATHTAEHRTPRRQVGERLVLVRAISAEEGFLRFVIGDKTARVVELATDLDRLERLGTVSRLRAFVHRTGRSSRRLLRRWCTRGRTRLAMVPRTGERGRHRRRETQGRAAR
jgi:hypothetical protein